MIKTRYALLIGLAILFTYSSFSQNIISGKVVDSTNDEVLTGANIIIKNSTIGTASNNKGKFQLNNLKDGDYTVRVSFFGYETIEKDVSLKGSPVELDFGLTETSIDLNAVVVTGTRSENRISQSPVFTQIISKKSIEQQGITYLPQVLASTDASFEMAKDNTVNSFSFGGLGAKYTLFLIDGERIAGETKGAIDLSRINPATIERIEVVKGAASTLYGSNAIGGVVNIITRSVSKPLEVAAGIKANIYNDPSEDETRSDNYYYTSVNLSEGKFSSFSDFKVNRYAPYDLSGGMIVDGQPAPRGVQGLLTQEEETNFTLSQKINYKASERLSFTARATYYQLSRDFFSVGYPDKLSKDLSFGAKASYFTTKNSKLELSWHSDRNKIYDVVSDQGLESDILDYDNLYQDIRFLGNYNMGEKNVLTAGVEYITEKQSSLQNSISDRSLNNFVIFLQDEISVLNDLDLIVGARTDIHSTFGTHFTPQASAMFSPGNFKFRANFGQGFRAPTVKELYTDQFRIPTGPTINYYLNGNSKLKPETSTYYSISGQYTNERFDFSVNYTENHVDNLILSDDSITKIVISPTPYGPMPTYIDYIYSNVSEAVIKSLNMVAKVRITNSLSLSGSYTYTNPIDKATDLKLVNVRKHNARVNVDFRKRFKKYYLGANLNGSYFSEKDVNDIYSHQNPQPRVELGDFTLFKLTTTHTFNNKYVVTLGVNNIFDVTDDDPKFFNLTSPGRSYVVGFSINL